MIDIGFTKIFVIGAVALIVIGPEKLPKVARMLGALIGKAQRYVADVKAEVNKSIELEELKKMKDSVETAAREVETSVQTSASEFEKDWAATTQSISNTLSDNPVSGSGASETTDPFYIPPEYKHPNKKWRVKAGTTPLWFTARTGVKRQALSGAARVARYRPKRLG